MSPTATSQVKDLQKALLDTNREKEEGLYSKQCCKNLRNAVAQLRGHNGRKRCLPFARKCLKAKPEIFVLIHAYYAWDTRVRMGRKEREDLLTEVINNVDKLEKTDILSVLVKEYGLKPGIADPTPPAADSTPDSTPASTTPPADPTPRSPSLISPSEEGPGGCGASVAPTVPTCAVPEVSAAQSGPRHNPERILRMLQNDEGFRNHLPKDIHPIQFCAIDDINEETRKLWEASTTGVPRLCRGSDCWRSREPTFEELWVASNKVDRAGKRTPRRRSRGGTLRRWALDRVEGVRERRPRGRGSAAGFLSAGPSQFEKSRGYYGHRARRCCRGPNFRRQFRAAEV